jgi:nitroreductase
MLTFSDAVRSRRSCRAFLPEPLARSVIEEILAEAQLSPSNCNTQPWVVHIVSGRKRDELSAAILQASREARYSSDFKWSVQDYPGRFRERQIEQGSAYYESLAVARSDVVARSDATEANYHFFGAPHLALLFFPPVGDNVRVAADVGMYGQTFLLALAARGLAGVPQTSLGSFAGTIREVLNIDPELKLLFGISFGRADPASPANKRLMPRDPVSASVIFHE